MSRVFRRGPAVVEANLTPMIDMTFLLIVFFVLVSRISEVENVRMELPKPEDPATVPPPEEGRVVLNILPGADGAAEGYRVGATEFAPTPEGRDALRAHLGGLFRQNPEIAVNLRADRSTAYAEVAPALEAVSAASRESEMPGAARINLVVLHEERGPRRP
ncbi:MAG: biopolymer transporter ExbD [Phycisphaerae bacterium]|nr:biopolymer transporter ExbD [Phycisphaerae bacterium]